MYQTRNEIRAQMEMIKKSPRAKAASLVVVLTCWTHGTKSAGGNWLHCAPNAALNYIMPQKTVVVMCSIPG